MDEKVVKADRANVEYGSDEKDPAHEEIEGGNGLRTVDVGFRADQVLQNLDFDEKEKTRILRKIDYRLIPILGVLYL